MMRIANESFDQNPLQNWLLQNGIVFAVLRLLLLFSFLIKPILVRNRMEPIEQHASKPHAVLQISVRNLQRESENPIIYILIFVIDVKRWDTGS